jgi:hypothetical protein
VRPYSEEVVQALQRAMAAHFLPELKSSYAQSQFGAAAMLFGIALRDADSAVQDLVDANAQLRELLADAGVALSAIDDDRAKAALATVAALPARAGDLRMSSLRAEYDGLRDAFSRLAPVIEPAADDPALGPLAPVRQRVYAWFSSDAARRTVPLLNN